MTAGPLVAGGRREMQVKERNKYMDNQMKGARAPVPVHGVAALI